MNDEFTLRWKNFQDNIASGFQNLYDRGDLVDVTLACDGKLLHAHKIVLAICSPYFQEIFITNPCKHPIIILKDVNFTIMCELLEFMYQGTVNVKHTELQAFMKIGQLLQIKGLAANSTSSLASNESDKSCGQNPNQSETEENQDETIISVKSSIESNETKSRDNSNNSKILSGNSGNAQDRSVSPSVASNSPIGSSINVQSNKGSNELVPHHSGLTGHIKRPFDYNSDTLSIYARNKRRRSITSTDQSSDNNDTVQDGSVNAEHMTEEFFFPHISMVESRYELHNIKREAAEHHQTSSASSLRNSFPPPNFPLDYNYYKNSSSNINNQSSSTTQEQYPNDLHMPNDFSKNFANHMDIPPSGTNMVMLSSTSLLHGNCVFNRNNTVATQQGMKTYWLCKSYRISMCRARCITHQGRIISATGVHNHTPHMKSGNNGGGQSASGNANGNANGNGGAGGGGGGAGSAGSTNGNNGTSNSSSSGAGGNGINTSTGGNGNGNGGGGGGSGSGSGGAGVGVGGSGVGVGGSGVNVGVGSNVGGVNTGNGGSGTGGVAGNGNNGVDNGGNSGNGGHASHTSNAHQINNDTTQPSMHPNNNGPATLNNNMNNVRFPHGINSATNIFQQNIHSHGPLQHIQHNRASPLMPPPPGSENHNHYGPPVANILMPANLLPPTQPLHPMNGSNAAIQNMMHNDMAHSHSHLHLIGNYSISSVRHKHDIYNHGNHGSEKTLSGDDHLQVRNESLLSPNNLDKNDTLNMAPNDDIHRDNEPKTMGMSDATGQNNVHHQAQVIESVTISPGTSHHFKMESM